MLNTLFSIIRGLYRIIAVLLIIIVGTFILLTSAILPIRPGDIRLPAWIAHYMASFALQILRLHVFCTDPELIKKHRGFIFPNHTSFLDIIVLYAFFPMRFLSKAEVRSWPFIGWMAIAVGTVFVKREAKRSRTQARAALAKVKQFPPIVLFPEGAINPDDISLLPFRHGAFEIVTQNSTPYIVTAILYDRLDIIHWGDESIWTAAWRLCSHAEIIEVEIKPIAHVLPSETDDPAQLAINAQTMIATAITEKQTTLSGT